MCPAPGRRAESAASGHDESGLRVRVYLMGERDERLPRVGCEYGK